MSDFGIELELFILLVLAVVGAETFAPFEVETPVWKKIFKWSVLVVGTLGLYQFVGHWSLLFAAVLGLAGLAFHFAWCSKNDIHPLRATPRRKYYDLRGWEWHE